MTTKKTGVFVFMLILLLIFSMSFASPPDFTFNKSVGNWDADTSTSYTLATPVALACDSQNNYYVADLANNRVLKLNSNLEKIDSINGIDMPLFVYVDKDDNILVCELSSNSIKKYSPDFQLIASWGGSGSSNGEFHIPRSIVQDSLGNYYVSDELNHRIQKFDNSGNFIATYGSYGSASGQFKVQQGLSIDNNDRLYVADTYNNRIQVFQTSPSWQFLTSFGQYGIYNPFNYFSFQTDIFNHPRGVYVDKNTGRVAVTDSLNNRVMVYNDYDSDFSFYESQNGYLNMALPTHAIIKNGYLRVLDSHSRIMKYFSNFNNTYMFSEYGEYRDSNSMLSNPQSVAVNPLNGNIIVSDSFNHQLDEYDADGNWIKKYGGIGGPYGYGTYTDYFFFPKQSCFDDQGTLYVADFTNGRIVYKNASSNYFYTEVSAYIDLPWGVAKDGNKLYVSDWKTNTIEVFENGYHTASWGGTGSAEGLFLRPADIKIGKFNNTKSLFVVDTGNNRVQVFNLNGNHIATLGEPTTDPLLNYEYELNNGSLLLPYGIAFDENDNIIISDTSHKCIRVFNQNGVLIDTWGAMSNTDGNFFSPMGMDYNKTAKLLYISDGVLQRVQIFDKHN